MRFRLDNDYAADVDAVAAAYTDPDLYAAFVGLPRADRPELLERRDEGDAVVVRVRWRFSAQLAPAARRVIDPDRLSWVEESRHDVGRRTVTFRMLPDHYRDRFSCSGTCRFEPSATGARRVVEGDVRVKAPLVARKVEKAIVSGLQEQLASEVPVVERFLASR